VLLFGMLTLDEILSCPFQRAGKSGRDVDSILAFYVCVMFFGVARAFSTRLRKPTDRQSHLTVGALTRIRKLLGIYNQFNSAGCYPLFLFAYLARQRCKSVTRWAFGWIVKERIKLTK
jgi:hypothetical protein